MIQSNYLNISHSNRRPLPCFDGIQSTMPKTELRKKSRIKKALNLITKGWTCTDIARNSGYLLINTIVKSGKVIANTAEVLKDVALHLKIFSIVNVPFTFAKIPSSIKNIWKGIQWKDREGIAHSTLLIAITMTSLFETAIGAIDAISKAFYNTPITWVADIVPPLGIAISAAKSLIRGHRLYQLSKFNRELDRKILALELGNTTGKKITSQELRIFLSPFLKKHLGTHATHQSAQAILERHTSAEVAAKMKGIAVLLENNADLSDDHITKIIDMLKDIQTLLHREKKLDLNLLTSSIISGLAFTLLLTPATPAAFVLLGISLAIEVKGKYDHKKFIDKYKKIQKTTIA